MPRRAPARRAVVLVDHGSREHAANAQLARLARALGRRLRGARVAVAHLSLVPPSLADAVESCVAGGAREIVVVPYFLAPGRHATRDVPRLAREVAARHPDVRIRVAEALGVHAGLVAAVHDRVRSAGKGLTHRASIGASSRAARRSRTKS